MITPLFFYNAVYPPKKIPILLLISSLFLTNCQSPSSSENGKGTYPSSKINKVADSICQCCEKTISISQSLEKYQSESYRIGLNDLLNKAAAASKEAEACLQTLRSQEFAAGIPDTAMLKQKVLQHCPDIPGILLHRAIKLMGDK